MSLTKATYSMISGAVVNAFDFMTPAMIADVQTRTGLVDTTAAIKTAIASLAPGGGVVHMPRGLYKTTAKITLTSGISLIGEGQFGGTNISTYDEGTTTILGVHSDTAIVSLVGSNACTVSDLCLQTLSTRPFPQSGLLLGRNSAASAGHHKIKHIAVFGNFDVANIYSIASEDNYWEDIEAWVYGNGNALNVFYTSIGNSNVAMTEPLTNGSNLNNVFVKFYFVNANPLSTTSCIYIDNAQEVGSWSFFGGYCIPAGGAYVTIRNAAIDGLSGLGPFTFSGVNGELFQGGDPLYGFNLVGGTATNLNGLCITNCRFAFAAGTNHYQLKKDAAVTLVAPNIVMQPSEAFPYAVDTLDRKKVVGGIVSTGRESSWTAFSLATAWVNVFGSPYTQAGYCVDANGFIHFRGRLQRTAAGSNIMFTLPSNLWPPASMVIGVGSGTGVGQIIISSTTGEVSLYVGVVTDQVDLSNVTYNLLP